jgi:ATP-dependent RNA helicase HelY
MRHKRSPHHAPAPAGRAKPRKIPAGMPQPRPGRTRSRLRMKPEADPVLKSVFARIGKPVAVEFRPDPFQKKALAAIKKTDCLVMAPTGSGKTWIAAEAIRSVFMKGGRAWYASPLKALTNAKWVEFGCEFGPSNVGIVTGDTKENTAAPIIAGTTEILRNQLYDAMHTGENLNCDLVILDEAHFLGDRDRGVVWEEIMIYLPARINLLLLSATIGNGEEIAQWLAEVRGKPCLVIREERRPVPLYPLFLHPSGRLMPLLDENRLSGKVGTFVGKRFPRPEGGTAPFGEMLEVLEQYRLLPAIFFLKSRAECDAALGMCGPPRDRTLDETFLAELE